MPTSSALGALASRGPRLHSRRAKGIALAIVLAAILVALAFKNDITLALRSGSTVRADFAQNYDIIPGKTRVKLAGLQVGVVSGLTQDADGVAHVSMKVDDGAIADLGATPQARVEPLTILGGEYAINLIPSNDGTTFTDATIPVSRTSTPVELDKVLDALPDPTRKALQSTVGELGTTLHSSGGSVRGLAKTASHVLKPAGQLVTAAQGRHPSTDLPTIVGDVQNLAASIDARTNDLTRSLAGLDRTTRTLALRSPDLASTIGNLPSALSATRRGTAQLDVTLGRLGSTSHNLLPTAQRAKPLVDVLEPTLRDALPTVRQLPALLRDAEPLVQQLVPISQNADAIVRDIKGPVIDRIKGPILTTLGSTYRGTGPFKDTGGGVQADNKFYQEIGYMVTNLDRASQTQDAQGSLLNFQAGFSAGSLGPMNLDDVLAALIPQVAGR